MLSDNQSISSQEFDRSPMGRFEKELQELLQNLISKKQIRHAIIAIETGDRSFEWIGAAGDAHPNGTPLREDTPFFIASVTKLYIATAILKLYEQGEIKIDSSISEYLPQSLIGKLHLLKGTDYTDKITIEHLLSHSSGLPDWLEDRPRRGKSLFENIENEDDRIISVDEAVAFVRDNLTPHFPPQSLNAKRRRIRYSDTNFQLLIAILERKMQKPIHQVFNDLIYKPLGLRNTYHPGHPPHESMPEPATVWVGDKAFNQPLLLQSFRDLISTASDLMTFMRSLINANIFQNKDTAMLMQRRWNRFGFPRDAAAIHLPGWPIEYGLGMMRLRMPRLFTPFRPLPAFIGHTGATGSWLFYSPDIDLYLCGAVDQLSAAAMPFRFVPKILRMFGNAINQSSDY